MPKKKHRPASSRRKINWRAIGIGGLVVAAVYVWAVYYFFVGPTGFRWRALYGDPNYPEGYELHGIDISHHQGDIDWDMLRTARVNGCPLRFCVVKATEGRTYIDPDFEDNYYQAREHGLVRGAYHFWNASASARQQAYFYLSVVDLEYGDLPPVLDVEQKDELQTTENFRREVLTWLHIVEDRYHKRPIIYTNYKFKLLYLNSDVFDSYPFWIAHYYVDSVRYSGNWKFWQHTDNGRLPGIDGPVDLDIYNGSGYDLQRLTIGY